MNPVQGSISRQWAIALNTFREAIRNKVLGILVLFAVAMMAFSLVLGELSLHEEERIMKDIGLAGISFFGTIIALFLGVNLLSKELDKKTVYAIIPKPLYRWEFLLGKFFGLAMTMLSLVALMAAVLGAFLFLRDVPHGTALLRAEVLVVIELILLTCVAMVFSSFSSPYLSAMFTGALWVIGRNTGELEAFASGKLEGRAIGKLLEVVLEVVPDFRMFYISGANLGEGTGVVSLHEGFVTWGYVGEAATYGFAYGATCLLIAVALFSKRDFT